MRRGRKGRYNVKTPDRLLDVAARLFAEHGYAGVALKDIIKEAGVNSAAVHYHFGDKRQLYRRVIERGLRSREEAAPLGLLQPETASPRERLRAFICNLMVQLLDDSIPAMMSRLMLREAIEPTVAFARAVDELPKRQLSILDGIVSELVEGRLSHTVVRRISLSILGQCVYYRYAEKILKRTDPRLRFSPRTVQAVAEHIFVFSSAAIEAMKRE